MNTLEQVIEQVFNPSSKDMRLFKEALLAQKDLSSLFNSNLNNKDSIEKTQTNQIRKPRAAPTPKPDDVRCQAVTWNLEMDDTNGQLKPKRCTRACDNGANFCKQHGLPDGKKCPQCSAHFCEDIIHQFKYEHMGTIHEPSWAFEKYHSDVLKIYQKSSAQPSNDNDNDNTVNPPNKKESKKTTKNTPKDENKPKRPLNPYMVYLKDNRKTIEQEVLLANPELKGKELQNAITKRAGELWKIAKETNTSPAEQTNNNNNDNTPTTEGEINNDKEQDQEQDQDQDQEQDQEQDDDDNTLNLTFHENLKVWYDSETDLYYDDENGNEAKGSIVNNILKPFKVAKK